MRFADLTLAFLLSNNLFFSHFLGVSESLGPNPFHRLVPVALGVLLFFCGGLFLLADIVIIQPFRLSFLTTLVAVMAIALGYLAFDALRRSMDKANLWPETREIMLHSLLLGGILLIAAQARDLVEFPVAVLAAVLGYSLSLVLLSAVVQRMVREKTPVWFQGIPFSLFTAGLVWLILNGLGLQFSGTDQ